MSGKNRKRVLVTGAGGFIGHHLVKRLRAEGHWVRGVDIKNPEYEETAADEFELLDLRRWDACLLATRGIDQVYNLAADMGGIGFISQNHALVARNNILINAHMLEASRINGSQNYLFSSTACIYPRYRQEQPEVIALKEEHAFPADPEPGYGFEKLFAEHLTEAYWQDHKMETRIARFHNVYGPLGTYDGGREKAPAAISRKVALAPTVGGIIEVWGDGKQTRSFTFIDDCVEGLLRIMASNHRAPLNLGSDEMVTISQLVDLTARIAGKGIEQKFDLSKPQGVRGRNSDNGRLREALGWAPSTTLEAGLKKTYPWIEKQVKGALDKPNYVPRRLDHSEFANSASSRPQL